MQACKEIKGCEYQVFINICLLLQYATKLDEKDRYDYQLQMKEWKRKWISSLHKQAEKIDFEILEGGSQEEEKGEDILTEDWIVKMSKLESWEGQNW